MKSKMLAAMIAVSCLGCTPFFGAPHLSFGECARRCRVDGMHIRQILHHGEFANTCVCELPPRAGEAGNAAVAFR